MAKVIVGITGNEKEMPVLSGLSYVAVAKDLVDGVKAAGGLPIVLPIGKPDLAKDYISMIDKLVLSGGQHIDPRFYGETRQIESGDYCLERDRFELALVREAIQQEKPIFAVCRGMQLVNVALGGTLHQSVAHHWQSELLGTSHNVEIAPASRVSQLFQQSVQVNSFHQQSINRLAPGLIVTARDPRDGTIEAVESQDGAILGLQWHPEFLCRESTEHRKLFDYLLYSL